MFLSAAKGFPLPVASTVVEMVEPAGDQVTVGVTLAAAQRTCGTRATRCVTGLLLPVAVADRAMKIGKASAAMAVRVAARSVDPGATLTFTVLVAVRAALKVRADLAAAAARDQAILVQAIGGSQANSGAVAAAVQVVIIGATVTDAAVVVAAEATTAVAVVAAALQPMQVSTAVPVAAVQVDRHTSSRVRRNHTFGKVGRTRPITGLWFLVGNEQHAL